ncbi:hypothetical protein AYL99_12112 [Fonsecaea erecta]|uniref:Uncharacterized protein n=1 Tax=Fonsecaea erecta TaxID=1367422 RepID=A0A178Z2R6_9EURO|nr:hypothetical protein AYL99_12112 [Fonsecaea erecta]OAP53706.1 hypothetical protein AYL99_12112 [Fonsecaea erecta]
MAINATRAEEAVARTKVLEKFFTHAEKLESADDRHLLFPIGPAYYPLKIAISNQMPWLDDYETKPAVPERALFEYEGRLCKTLDKNALISYCFCNAETLEARTEVHLEWPENFEEKYTQILTEKKDKYTYWACRSSNVRISAMSAQSIEFVILEFEYDNSSGNLSFRSELGFW